MRPGSTSSPRCAAGCCDGGRQSLGAESPEDEEALFEDPGQHGIRADLGHPVSAHSQHDLSGVTRQLPEQFVTVGWYEIEDLLSLVDDQHVAGGHGDPGFGDDIVNASAPGAQRGEDSGAYEG